MAFYWTSSSLSRVYGLQLVRKKLGVCGNEFPDVNQLINWVRTCFA